MNDDILVLHTVNAVSISGTSFYMPHCLRPIGIYGQMDCNEGLVKRRRGSMHGNDRDGILIFLGFNDLRRFFDFHVWMFNIVFSFLTTLKKK